MNELAARCRAYETVARAIRFVKQRRPCQPSLQEIAAHVGMSHFHLQRLFSVWVGISPKRFLQYLTTEHARSLLRGKYDVLAAAHAAGLSGPGRLHDLMVACDAATPGEVRSLGEGLQITYGFAPTPFGRVIAGSTARGLCHLQFVNANDSTDDADGDGDARHTATAGRLAARATAPRRCSAGKQHRTRLSRWSATNNRCTFSSVVRIFSSRSGKR
jgi:AraC-like DNA-binding protein